MRPIDGCIETMHYKNGKVMLLYSHIKRLRKSMKHISGERLDEHAFKNDLLAYIQTIDECEYVIRVQYNRNAPQFIFSKRPMPSRVHTPKVGIALNHLMPIHPHTWIKKTDRYYYNLATAFAKEKHWDDIILLNKNGMICESTISNIFIKNKNTYYTPSLDQGCVAGIYRHRFITECKTKGIEVIEKPLSIQDLQAAESVYLCNAVRKLYPIRLMASAGSDRMDITDSPLTQTQFPFE